MAPTDRPAMMSHCARRWVGLSWVGKGDWCDTCRGTCVGGYPSKIPPQRAGPARSRDDFRTRRSRAERAPAGARWVYFRWPGRCGTAGSASF
jgi:hypothetical protein